MYKYMKAPWSIVPLIVFRGVSCTFLTIIHPKEPATAISSITIPVLLIMASQPIILVTAATGTQASSLIRALSSYVLKNKSPLTIHATTREPSSATAADLVSANTNDFLAIKLFKTDFSDLSTLTRPTTNATHAFVNATPMSGTESENLHAQNILTSLRTHASSSMQRIVYTSASALRDPCEPSNYNNIDAYPWMKAYFTSKYGIETSVINFATSLSIPYTILQPGMFLTNLLPPASQFMYPLLSSRGQPLATTALTPDHLSAWVDPERIGSFAANAFLLPASSYIYTANYQNKRITIAAWKLTLSEVLESMNAYLASDLKPVNIPAGTKATAQYMSHEEAEAQKETNPLVASQLFMNENAGLTGADMELDNIGEKYGVEMGSLEGFWERVGAKGMVASALGY